MLPQAHAINNAGHRIARVNQKKPSVNPKGDQA
jgi:hypothetical protein